MNFFANLPMSRLAWLSLGLSAVLLEICALFFQYYLGLAPCIMCIYQRCAVLGLTLCLITAINPSNIAFRVFGYFSWGISSLWGWIIANEHIAMQTNTDPFAFSCEIVPNFPDFMPLHEWFPAFFAATGDCGQISWSFLGLSMPAWMQVIFTVFSILLLLIVGIRLIKTKSL